MRREPAGREEGSAYVDGPAQGGDEGGSTHQRTVAIAALASRKSRNTIRSTVTAVWLAE